MPYQVTQPCSEDWSKMQPVKGGRFCDKCQKKVHDLTLGEPLSAINGEICGRIGQTRIKNTSFTDLLRRQKPLTYFLLFIALLFSKNARSQNKDVEITDLPDSLTPADSIGKKINISGVLKDKKTNEAIPFACLIAYDRNNVRLGICLTNIDGQYNLQLNGVTSKTISLKATYLGYQNLVVNNIPLNSLKKIINIKLKSDEVILGLVGSVEYKTPLIDPDGSSTTFSREDFLHHPKG